MAPPAASPAGKPLALLAWSSGKDGAWALQALRRDPEIDVVGLFTVVNARHRRASIHGVREEILRLQAKSIGLPLSVIEIPDPCSHEQYESAMRAFVEEAQSRGIARMAFGDLFLQDVRAYREKNLAGTGMAPAFPLWGEPTEALARRMISSGLRAFVTCIDPKKLPRDLAGRPFDESFLADLPPGIDPCGENGEFHTVAVAGPMFARPIPVRIGDIVERSGFVFADVLPA